jgi:hypothetical protein
LLQKKENLYQDIKDIYHAMEVMAMDIFAPHGWRCNARIDA